MEIAPEKIYLQICGDCQDNDCENCKFEDLEDNVTWSKDKIFKNDVVYNRINIIHNNNQFGYDISIVEHNNEKWVRVQAMGEDFIIAPHDLTDENGKVITKLTQPDLMARLRKLGLTTFNRKQGLVIVTLIKEINSKLEEAGGDKFADCWYVGSELWRPVECSDEYYRNGVWMFSGHNGCFDYNSRLYGFFRCRPVIEYKEKGAKE